MSECVCVNGARLGDVRLTAGFFLSAGRSCRRERHRGDKNLHGGFWELAVADLGTFVVCGSVCVVGVACWGQVG